MMWRCILEKMDVPSMRILILPVVLAIVVSTAVIAGIVKTDSFQAISDGVNVTLRWITEDETNVKHFEIERCSGTDVSFVLIATIDPKGPSLYEFVDFSAFHKTTTLYQYRIKVVYLDNTPPMYVGPISVAHTVSGVRKTWGSIKAMFR